MQDPPRVDVVVSETLGNYALEEGIIATLADARARFLKPGGRIIPSAIAQFVAPVTAGRLHEELSAWDRVGHGLDLAVAKFMSLNNAYVRTLRSDELLEPAGKVWDRVDLTRDGRSNRKGEASWKLRSAATVYGFAAWWEATLAPGIALSTAPGAPPTHWEQLYFPLLAPMPLGSGETLTVALRSRTAPDAGTHLAWTAVRIDKAGKAADRQALDLDKGFLP
jgi:protein arginine N-methyltransferase 1